VQEYFIFTSTFELVNLVQKHFASANRSLKRRSFSESRRKRGGKKGKISEKIL